MRGWFLQTVVVALLPGGCTVGPDYVAPRPDLPSQWSEKLPVSDHRGTPPPALWWRGFHDPVLNRFPGDLQAELAQAAEPGVPSPPPLPNILPSDVLRRRPDIRKVLDSQRTTVLLEDAVVQSQWREVVDVIAFYKATGGGWGRE